MSNRKKIKTNYYYDSKTAVKVSQKIPPKLVLTIEEGILPADGYWPKPTECAWPTNNGKPWLFCCKPIKKDGISVTGGRTPYCNHHHFMAYKK